MDSDSRLDRLEETVFFQEKTIAELSEALLGQQNELAALERRLEITESRLEAALHALAERSAGGDPELPPHYL